MHGLLPQFPRQFLFTEIAPGWDRSRDAGLRGRTDNHYTTPAVTAVASAHFSAEKIGFIIARDVIVLHMDNLYLLVPIYNGARDLCVFG